MKMIELDGEINAERQLRAQVPECLSAGPVRVIVLLPDEEEQGAAREWSDDLGDPRQDIYTLHDGQPVNASG